MTRWITIAVCSSLLLAFALISWSAERGKSATYDEPLHSVAGFVLTLDGDYRLNPEDPPLWQRWANLFEPRSMLHVNENDPTFQKTPGFLESRYLWIKPTLYSTGNDADAFLMRQRIMLISLGVMLGAMLALWSGQVAGPVAAIAATTLFALDPNFLAHAAMIKNDVAITLVGFSICYATWRMGRRLTIGSAVAVVALAAIGMVTKFSWPLLVIALFLLLFLRALLPWPWVCCGGGIQKWWARLGIVLGIFIAVTAVGYVTIWANYSFRFAPAPNGAHWDIQPLLMETEFNELSAEHPDRKPSFEELQAWHPHGLVSAALFCGEHRLLPETYLYGLIYTYRSSRLRSNFLCGQFGLLGSWYYFPLAFVFKMPIASLAAVLLALGIAVSRIRLKLPATFSWAKLWTIACLTLPAVVFAGAVMNSNMNIGFRHFLPVMPFVYVGVAAAMAMIFNRWGRNGRMVLGGLAVGLLAEAAIAYPDYIAFFNQICGGPTGGIKLLGDSNLDWGQDLPLLAAWQRDHPQYNDLPMPAEWQRHHPRYKEAPYYLSYFGSADPNYYGIHGDSIVGDYLRPPSQHIIPNQPGVLAISATNLQGIYMANEDRKQLYDLLKHSQLIDVLGGTIYLYLFNP
jgi:hypothetical protein